MDQRIAILFHLLSVVIWVGGMFFAYMAMRPAAAQTLEPAQRLTLWAATFKRFFPWVWLSIFTLLSSGFYIIARFGGFAVVGTYVHIMLALGVLMMLIFGHVYFAGFSRLKSAVAAQDWKAGGNALAKIRILIGLNLSLGIVTVFVAILGKLFV